MLTIIFLKAAKFAFRSLKGKRINTKIIIFSVIEVTLYLNNTLY